jgi:rhodanese-related sulfurtransferase
MSTVDYSDIVGIFRERSHADQAVDDLKQAGFAEDEVHLTEYELQDVVEGISPSLQPSNKRIVVHVKAPGKEQEAVGILVQHGANNADIPPGTALVHGTLVGTNVEVADLVAGQSNEVSSSDDLLEARDVSEHPGEAGK